MQRRLIFLFFFLSYLDAFDDSGRRPVSVDGGVSSSLTGISRLISCLNLASLTTAFLVCYFTKRATGTVSVDEFRRWSTRAWIKQLDLA